jgi:hypothetical protein
MTSSRQNDILEVPLEMVVITLEISSRFPVGQSPTSADANASRLRIV